MATRKPNSSSSKQLTENRAKAGKKGGEAGRGEVKVRDRESLVKAAKVRWAKHKEKKALEAQKRAEEMAQETPPEAPED